MLSENEKREIKEFEDAGIDVIKFSGGKEVYNSVDNTDEDVCNGCEFLKIIDDPDPTDWFRDDDKMAMCELLDAVIAGALEPRDLARLYKPVFCPKLKRELTEEQKSYVDKALKFAKRRYKEKNNL